MALGSAPKGTDVKSWTKVGNVTSAAIMGLSLHPKSTYYVSIVAVDEAGLESAIATSNGFRVMNSWVQEAYIKAANADANDVFGSNLMASDDTLVVGTLQESSNQTTVTNGTTASSDNSATFAGAAYVYRRSGNLWSQEAYLKASNAVLNSLYGTVAVDRDTIVVGAQFEYSNQSTITNGTTSSSNISGAHPGAAYVYQRIGSSWVQQAYLKASNNNSTTASFGFKVDISTDTIAVSATQESGDQTTITNGTGSSTTYTSSQSGAVYIYKRSGTTWAQEAYIKPPNNASSSK